MAGMESKNEYRAAISRRMPSSNAMLIVEPDLEIPGMMASPCTTPIINAFLGVRRSVPGCSTRVAAQRVSHKSKPVTISIKPTINTDANSRSAIPRNKNPRTAVGMDPITISNAIFKSGSDSIFCKMVFFEPVEEISRISAKMIFFIS